MSSLSSSSTLDEIKDAYADNASYQEDASVTKAKAFVTACRLLLLKLPRRVSHAGGDSVELSADLIQKELEEAKQWLATAVDDTGTTGASSGVKHVSFENFRD